MLHSGGRFLCNHNKKSTLCMSISTSVILQKFKFAFIFSCRANSDRTCWDSHKVIEICCFSVRTTRPISRTCGSIKRWWGLVVMASGRTPLPEQCIATKILAPQFLLSPKHPAVTVNEAHSSSTILHYFKDVFPQPRPQWVFTLWHFANYYAFTIHVCAIHTTIEQLASNNQIIHRLFLG